MTFFLPDANIVVLIRQMNSVLSCIKVKGLYLTSGTCKVLQAAIWGPESDLVVHKCLSTQAKLLPVAVVAGELRHLYFPISSANVIADCKLQLNRAVVIRIDIQID